MAIMLTAKQRFFIVALMTMITITIYFSKKTRSFKPSPQLFKKIPDDLKSLVCKCEGENESLLRGPPQQDDPKLLEIVKKDFLLPPTTLPINLTGNMVSTADYSWRFYKYYSQLLLGNQKPGFFFEAGALQGEHASNTLLLETEKGWTGILVEVDIANFRALKQKRRNAWLSNTCISSAPYPQKVLFEFLEAPDTSHKDSIVHKANSRSANSPFSVRAASIDTTSKITKVHMQCFPVASYLLALNVTTLDYLSLDIQGFEWNVIKALPLDKIKVRVIAVEYYVVLSDGKPGMKFSPDFAAYMDKIGYYLVDVTHQADYVFAWKNDPVFKDLIGQNNYVKYKDFLEKEKKSL